MLRASCFVFLALFVVACQSPRAQVDSTEVGKSVALPGAAEHHRIRLSVVCKNPDLQSIAERAFRRGLGLTANIEFVSTSFGSDVQVGVAESDRQDDVVAVSACVVSTSSNAQGRVLLHDVRAVSRSDLVAAREELGRKVGARCFGGFDEEVFDRLRQGETDLIDVDSFKKSDR